MRSISDVVKEGQTIVVQVEKEAIGTKGPRVVTELSIPGRFLVLMPNVDYVGVSRRIADEEERARLKKLAESIRGKNMGVIVRTVAEGKSEEELVRDYRVFAPSVEQSCRRKPGGLPAPSLLYKDHDLTYRLVRDEFDASIDKFVVDSAEDYRKTLELLDSISARAEVPGVSVTTKARRCSKRTASSRKLRRLLRRRVWLDSGGYLVIDQTEALVSIDVNTGKFIGTTHLADTVLQDELGSGRGNRPAAAPAGHGRHHHRGLH